MRRGHQVVAVGGEDDAVDQRVDGRVLDAHQLREPGASAAFEPQKSRCSLPGDYDCASTLVTMSKSKLRTRLTYWLGRRCAASRRCRSCADSRYRGWTTSSSVGSLPRNLDLELLAGLGVDHLAALIFQPASANSCDRLAQILPLRLRRVVDRQLEFGCVNTSGGSLSLYCVEDFQLLALRQAARGEIAALEIAVGARVEAEEQRAVHRLEIEGVGQRLAHAAVLELRPAQIEHEALHRLRRTSS